QDLLPGARLRLHPVAGGVPVDELHRDEHLIAKGADVVDGDDVGVRQARDGLRLAQRALPPLAHADAVLDARAQQLDGDLVIQLGIEGGVDLAHPAAPQESQYDVATDARPPRERRRHWIVAVPAHPTARLHRRIRTEAELSHPHHPTSYENFTAGRGELRVFLSSRSWRA